MADLSESKSLDEYEDTSPDYEKPFDDINSKIYYVAILIPYIIMLALILRYRNEPKVISRSPLLLIVIIIGASLDSLFQSIEWTLSLKFLRMKC